MWSCAQVSDSFPFKWINKKWKEGFYVTSMATSHTRWAVVMSRNAGFIDQVTFLHNMREVRACHTVTAVHVNEIWDQTMLVHSVRMKCALRSLCNTTSLATCSGALEPLLVPC